MAAILIDWGQFVHLFDFHYLCYLGLHYHNCNVPACMLMTLLVQFLLNTWFWFAWIHGQCQARHFSCSWLASKYMLVFIIVVIVQPKIVQAVKLEQMFDLAPFKMAPRVRYHDNYCDDVVLEAPY